VERIPAWIKWATQVRGCVIICRCGKEVLLPALISNLHRWGAKSWCLNAERCLAGDGSMLFMTSHVVLAVHPAAMHAPRAAPCALVLAPAATPMCRLFLDVVKGKNDE
jgi:hypothetical protein